MPIGSSAKKSLRKSVKNRKFNYAIREEYKLAVKTFLGKPSAESLVTTQSVIDKASKRGIIHHNKASRLISRLAKVLSNGTVKKETAKKPAKRTAKAKMSK